VRSPRRVGALLSGLSAAARSPLGRWGFGLFAVTLAVWAVASRRDEVLDAFGRLEPGWTALAVLATAANVCAAGLVWRAVLADLGDRLPLRPAARVFFVGQIGKYLPGSVWPVVMQAELGRDHGVPRRDTAAATGISLLISVTSAFAVVLATIPLVPDVLPGGFGWAVLALVPLAALLRPRVLGPLLDRALRLAGREPLNRRPGAAGIARAFGWAVLSWAMAGVQVWALGVPLGADAGPRGLALAVGGYALAWGVGFLVVLAPAGAGPRELALAAALAPVLDGGEVVVVVLLSRVIFTVTDLAFAGAGIWLARSVPRPARPRGTGRPTGPAGTTGSGAAAGPTGADDVDEVL
jgi:glycosyltransferase 2 family protein